MTGSITISEEQALWFRARRGYLAGGGAESATRVVRAVAGIQAQQEGPALIGLSQRMAQRPDAATLCHALAADGRQLVRTWGQRDTLHLYAVEDWPYIAAIRSQWASTSRRGPAPSDDLLQDCIGFLNEMTEPITRKHLFSRMPAPFVAELEPFAQQARMDATRLAASRTLWRLAQMGYVCIAGNQGSERLYAPRSLWFPDLSWPELTPDQAAAVMARRYLATYGPASPTDLAHFYGIRVRDAKLWLTGFEKELIPVQCEGRKNLLILEEDARDLQQQPAEDWPVRLLPLWDGLLMGHKDKSLIIPDALQQKRVWRKGSYVAAVVLARGRIIATWAHDKKRKRLHIQVEPLSRWQPRFVAAVQEEAGILASHMGLEGAEEIRISTGS